MRAWAEAIDSLADESGFAGVVSAVTHTVISNSSYGAWPVAQLLDELLAS
jgi:hypothetical protein